MSAIVISAVLLVTAATAGFVGFYHRSNGLDAELKARSAAAADACADAALLTLAQGGDPGGRILSLNSLDECRIGAVSGSAQKTFRVQATSTGAVTNLEIIADGSDLSVLSWREISTF